MLTHDSTLDDAPLAHHRADLPLALFATLVAIAAVVSGPLGFLIVQVAPQPPWTDVATYAHHAHGIQQLPYWAGFVLLASCVLLVARVAALGFDHHRTRSMIALVLVAMYGALIFLNYALQVAYVPYLARTEDPTLAYVTMVHGGAPTWVLEMFGYALLGFATIVIAPMFAGREPRRRRLRALLVVNGVLSIAGAIATAARLDWVQTVPGLVAYLAWNVVFVAPMVLLAIEYRPRTRRPALAVT